MPSLLKMQVEELQAAIPQMSERDRGFAQSLCDQFIRRGLSAKQADWVVKLTERAKTPADAPKATVEIGDLHGVISLLKTAQKHLKHPAVLVQAGVKRDADGTIIDEGIALRLNIAGQSAKAPGSINVCSPGSWGDRSWFGRVGTDGKFEPSQRFDADTHTAIAAALTALAHNPAQAAADYGHMTGVCCFCGIVLTDERSTGVGYGPICAKHYGLPWGVTAAREVAAREAEPVAAEADLFAAE